MSNSNSNNNNTSLTVAIKTYTYFVPLVGCTITVQASNKRLALADIAWQLKLSWQERDNCTCLDIRRTC